MRAEKTDEHGALCPFLVVAGDVFGIPVEGHTWRPPLM